jgi:hypothetical protein
MRLLNRSVRRLQTYNETFLARWDLPNKSHLTSADATVKSG